MKISALSPVVGYQKQDKQKENINFGSMFVLGKDIADFKTLFPKAVSLTDPELYATHWHGFRQRIIAGMHNLQNDYLGKHYNGKLEDKHLSGFVPHVFITPEEKDLFSEVLTKAESELTSDTRYPDIDIAFSEKLARGEGFFGVLNCLLDCFTAKADLVKASDIEPFLRKIGMLQENFASAYGGTEKTLESLRQAGIIQ